MHVWEWKLHDSSILVKGWKNTGSGGGGGAAMMNTVTGLLF